MARALARALARIHRWAAEADPSGFNALITAAFGASALAGSDALRETLRAGRLSIGWQLLDGNTLRGIRAGYTPAWLDGKETILINRDWLQSAADDGIEAVVLEELGHALDHRLNGSNDASGDEGEIFSALLRGTQPAPGAASDNDHRTITAAGQAIQLEAAATSIWTRLSGGTLDDFGTATAVAADGSVYTAGFGEIASTATIPGWDNVDSGAREAFFRTSYSTFSGSVRRYSADGALIWSVSVLDTGTTPKTRIHAIATASDGSVVVAGSTSLGSSSTVTAFLRRLSSTDGSTLWHRNLGPLTLGAPSFNSEATDLAIASDGSLTISGRTAGQISSDLPSGGTDIFVARYQLDGSQSWMRQYGTTNTDAGFGVAVGADGSAYIGGVTYGLLDGQPSNIVGISLRESDGFISKFNASGTRLWTRVLSATGLSSSTRLNDLAVAADGALYAVGSTSGTALLGQSITGANDGFLARLTADGTSTWTRLIQGTGTNRTTIAQGVATGLDGFIYVSGNTNGLSLDGQASSGGIDGFVSQFDSSGTRAWSQLLGTSGEDGARSLAVTGSSLYVSGASEGDLNGQTNAALTNRDAFLSKLDTGTAALLPPTVTSLSVTGSLLTLVLDKVLSSTLPDITAFSVLVNGAARGVSAVSVNPTARSVSLTLASAVIFGDSVSLNYTDKTTANDPAGVIQDAAGNDLLSFGAPRSVTNLSDGTAPTISSAVVNAATLTITLNELLSSVVPEAARFLVNVNGTARAISAVSSNPTGPSVSLTLASAVTAVDGVTLSYSDRTAANDLIGVIEDQAGNDLANTSTALSVTNQTPVGDTTAPQITSQQVNGAALTLTLNETLSSLVPELARFSVLVNGVSRGVTAVSVVGVARTVTLQLASAVVSSDVVSFSYADKTINVNDGTGVIEDAAGNDLADVTGLAVMNTTPPADTTAPTIRSLSINGSLLRIIANETLASTLPDLARFTVRVNGAIQSIGTISLLATDEIQLQLNQSVTSADVVSLDYTDASALNDATGVVQDPSGNDMASFSNQPVTNLTAAGLGPALSNINVNSSTVTLVFATPLAATVPDVARFSVLVNGLARQVVSAAVSTTTNTVSLTLISAPTATERLTLSYTDKTSLDDTTGVIQTTAGVDLGDISNRPADTYISSSTVAALNTIYTTLNLIGTAAIQGTANSNNNRISGNGAANQLNGGAGNDSLAGNLGNDTLLGGAGDDSLDGGAGTDTASYAGSALAVRVDLSVIGAQNTQGDGFDTLIAIENLNGSPFNDFLTGNTGNNTINGGLGADEMSGGRGNDTYVVDNAGDTVIEFFNQGTDLVQSSITFILDLNGTENLTLTGTAAINGDGNTLNNAIIGNSARNVLRGFDGNDVLNAAAGDDDLIGGNGNDQLVGGAGNDLIDGGPGVDTASYAGISAGVTVALGVVGAQATGGGGTDTLIGIECLTGSSFHDNLTGDGLANTLSGGAGQDTLDGGEGNDLLIGGAGADLLTGGLGTNTFRFALSDSLLASMDTITDLVVGFDVIDGPRAVSAANLAEVAGNVATLSQADIAAKLTATAFPALGAATFTYAPVGSAVRTFLALNDATAGFDSLRDAVIELKPYYGSLTALAVV